MTQLKEGRHYRVEEWTRRQRQVFDLLVKNRTNREIAEELGVSLDGAKWHVSEIITKLGVDSREEAADYWREYNGWPRRLHRMFRGIIGGGMLKWAGGAGVTVGGTGIVAVALYFGFGGGNSAPADAEESPAPEETQQADGLRERLIESMQTQIEVDMPEDDDMALLMSTESDRPAADDMTEEQMLRQLLEAQSQGD